MTRSARIEPGQFAAQAQRFAFGIGPCLFVAAVASILNLVFRFPQATCNNFYGRFIDTHGAFLLF